MPRIDVGDAEIKIDEKGQKFLFVLFYLEYPLSLESEIKSIKWSIDRLNKKLVSTCGPFRSKNKT